MLCTLGVFFKKRGMPGRDTVVQQIPRTSGGQNKSAPNNRSAFLFMVEKDPALQRDHKSLPQAII